jgi:4-diphosphocytidyl-2C-methyl-D-erythritol kinase
LFDIICRVCLLSGAGLGGGSANAATTLFAANKLCGDLASEEDLLKWSGAIGSDISVFFSKVLHRQLPCADASRSLSRLELHAYWGTITP